jgi:hypothetical protein
MWGLWGYRSASDLKSSRYQRAHVRPLKERRGLMSIGVIDDSPFNPKNNLETLGYRITLLGDPGNLDAVKDHHIILCDLQGVGQALGAETQGAFLIKEIRETFPEKYVVAFTGGALNQSITREAVQASDEFLKKDADIETWVEKLDSIIQKLLDPYQVWQRQRRALVKKEVDTKTILMLEDTFVKSISSNGEHGKGAFVALVESSKLGEDARAVVRSMIASGLFKLLIG